MREVAGLAALDGVLLAVGLALAIGIGLVRTWRDALRLAGLAFLLGWAAVGVGVTYLLEAGRTATIWQTTLVAAALAAAGLALAKAPLQHSVTRSDGASVPGWTRWAAVPFVVGLLGYIALAAWRAWVQGASDAPGAWSFWLPRAESLVRFDGIDLAPGGFAAFAFPHYPLLVPGMDALAFRVMDTTEAMRLPLQEWLLYVAFLGAIAGLLWRRVPAVILWPGLLALAALPSLTELVGSALADLPLAVLFGVAGVCAALWLAEGSPAYLGAVGILLAAVAVTTSDGFPLSLLLVAVLAVAALAARRPGWWHGAPLALAPLVAAMPWQLWVASHDLPPPDDYRFRDLLDPGHLADRTDRLATTLETLPRYLLQPDRWLLAVPLCVAAAILARRATAVFALGLLAVVFVFLTFVYWGGYMEIEPSEGQRVSPPAVFAAALVPLLLTEALRERGGPSRST